MCVMNNIKLAIITLSSLISLYLIHIYGISKHLYVGIWYYDLIAHFLGGICLALSALYILKNPKYIILITFILGVMWEIYEWYFNLTGHPFGSYEYNFDTIKDLIIDTIGAVFVWYIVSRNKIRK